MSTRGSSPPLKTTDPCCNWCSRIILCDESRRPLQFHREGLQVLFHSDCECRGRENSLPSSACGFCKHLNIRHLLHCAFIRDGVSFPLIFSNWYCRKNSQNGCQLCEYIASRGTSEPEIGLTIYMGEPSSFYYLNEYLGGPKYSFNAQNCGPNYFLKLLGTDNEDDYIRLSQESLPRLQEHVNWEKIKGWLSETYVEKKNLPVDFRVIDVERNCIVAPDYPVEYVTLSYVWGKSSQKEKPFQASIRNINDLEIDGSLSGAPLPRTITDAMEACRQLGRLYLWVDRLCILQDHESKHDQIQRMDSIYGCSEFTIIALSGQDANDGLPGVSEPRNSRRPTFLELQGITLTDTFPSIQKLVQSSYWAKRGWTFQEELCSRNNLYFTEYGVYYSTRHGGIPNSECLAEQGDAPTQSFQFPTSVEAYAARSFTDPGDLLRAFTGVLNMKFGSDHYFGNATPHIEESGDAFYDWIHWQPVDWEYEARSPPKNILTEPVSHIEPHKSDIFPSWSWTSVQGGVRFYQDVVPVALWAFSVAQESQKDSNVNWVSNYDEACWLESITVEGGLMRKGEFAFQPEKKGKLISASSTPFKKADQDEACKKFGRILSFTQIASLGLESLHDHSRDDGRPTFRIMSSAGKRMGGIWIPKLSLEYIFNNEGSLKKNEFEFMALSTLWKHDEGVERLLNDIGLEFGKHRAILNVMLIWHAKDSNVARRLGIGHVFKDQWFKERPVLKTVILE